MKDFIILPDVTCDLSPELAQRFGLVDYIRGYVHVGDRQLRTTLDWENISRDEFYSALSNKRISVSSAAASPEEYYECFKKYHEAGYAILSMSISSKISVTYNTASAAAQRLRDEFPEFKEFFEIKGWEPKAISIEEASIEHCEANDDGEADAEAPIAEEESKNEA